MQRPQDPYVALIWAACNDSGLRLTAAEVLRLASDDAILSTAEMVAEGPVWDALPLHGIPGDEDASREQRILYAYREQRKLDAESDPGPHWRQQFTNAVEDARKREAAIAACGRVTQADLRQEVR